ncbi:MAG TPA: DUF4197 domain-containing protein, partial [Flavobacteriaceae bacterium]|nr:DUF4197 domain-containing protein [Flavobacteriaceae bacterium]
MKKIILSLTLISAFAVNAKAQDLQSIFGTLKKEVEKVNTQPTTQNNSTVKVVNSSTESKTISAESLTKLNGLSNATVASGLKEALSLGLTDG